MSDRTEWTSQRHWTQNTERRQTKQKHITENKKIRKPRLNRCVREE